MNTWVRRIAALAGLVMTLSFTACGGGGGAGGGEAAPELAPTISTQPASTTVTEGGDATFSVVATGTPAPTYQWQRNGVDIAGATSSSLTVPAVIPADNGAPFRVVVSNTKGSVTSAAATLTVNSPPAIVSQPVGATVNPRKPANFLVVASGTGPLSYQWQRDGVDIAGATSASYSFASPVLEDDGAGFRVVVSNGQGTAISDSAALRVTPDIIVPPTIVTQPQSVTVVDGAPAILSVAATGTGPFRYQWRKNGAPIVGATNSIYTTEPLTPADSGTKYSVLVSDSDTSVTSDDATVTVNFLPLEWLVQPAATSVAPGQVAVFIAGAFGSQPVTYQWKRNGADIAGATDLVYTTPATTLADNGALYSVVATNPVGSITSTAALLTVGTPVALSITTAPASLTVNAGQIASFSVTVAGTAPLSYQWLRNGTNIAGATAASYSTPATTAADNAARFSVRVTNPVGSVTSTEAVLTVQLVPSPLDGRAWTAGQLLETDDNLVRDRVSGIDDAGRVTVVFRKSNGTRDVIYATRGTPNANATAPTWSTPVAIDLLAGLPVSSMGTVPDYNLVVAPGGNALAYWFHSAPCSAATYAVTGNCRYYYLARYTASSDSWAAPELITDATRPAFQVRFNDSGDIALFGTSWIRSGTRGFTAALALFSRSASQATLSRQLMNAVPLGAWSLDMDAAGNILLAAEAQQNATTDLVAYRGTAASGLGSQQVLDTRGAAATLLAARLGLNGQQVVTWQQSNGTAVSVWAAASGTASEAWAVQELAALREFGDTILTVADNGDALLVNRYYGWRWGWTGGAWSALSDFPSNGSFAAPLLCAHARNGNYLCVDGGTGRWSTYDANRNAMVQAQVSNNAPPPEPGFVLGLYTINLSVGYDTPLLSIGGIGATTLQNRYDVLPSPAAPAGDSRTVTNLWGIYLK